MLNDPVPLLLRHHLPPSLHDDPRRAGIEDEQVENDQSRGSTSTDSSRGPRPRPARVP